MAKNRETPCGAKTRNGTPCQARAMPNGRCRIHGGLSTGAKTAKGIERIRAARTKHGRFSREQILQRKIFRELLRRCTETLRKF